MHRIGRGSAPAVAAGMFAATAAARAQRMHDAAVDAAVVLPAGTGLVRRHERLDHRSRLVGEPERVCHHCLRAVRRQHRVLITPLDQTHGRIFDPGVRRCNRPGTGTGRLDLVCTKLLRIGRGATCRWRCALQSSLAAPCSGNARLIATGSGSERSVCGFLSRIHAARCAIAQPVHQQGDELARWRRVVVAARATEVGDCPQHVVRARLRPYLARRGRRVEE